MQIVLENGVVEKYEESPYSILHGEPSPFKYTGEWSIEFYSKFVDHTGRST